MSEPAGVPLTIVLFILVIVNIIGNSLVCLIIKRNRDMRIPRNYLLMNLAAADILYATFIAPKLFFKFSFTHHLGGMTGTVLCKLLTDGTIAWVGGVSAIVTLVVVAVERYFAVMYPHGNKWKLTKAKLKVIIPGSWLFASILNIPEFLVKDIEKVESEIVCVFIWPKDWMAKANSLTGLVVVALSIVLMIALYSRVVYTLWFKRNDDNQLTHQQKGVLRVRKRVTVMLVTVTAIFGICWGTDSVIYFLNCVKSCKIGLVLEAITDTMVLFNSAVNPIVYALFNQQFRKKMKGMLCCAGSSTHEVHPWPEALDIAACRQHHPPHSHAAQCSSE